MNHRIVIVIPVYNESEIIESVLEELQSLIDYLVIVIDDGSADNTYEKIPRKKKVIALRHKINRGKGAAVKTGIVAANKLGADVVVTMDGDGQHDPEDIDALVSPILSGEYEVTLGSRRKKKGEMPFLKIIANNIGNTITWMLYGMHVSDSQSGFRAYSRNAARIIDTKADKYEYDSKVIREINSNRLSFLEVPIQVRYTEYSMGKKQKQGIVNGLKTLIRMVWDIFV